MKKINFVPLATFAVCSMLCTSFCVAEEVRVLKVEKGGLTPCEALEAVRKGKAEGYKGAWEVKVASGVHEVKNTLEFLPSDSGTPSSPVTWTGEDGAIICGGKTINGWKETSDGLWVADAPCGEDGKAVFFESMYAHGRRIDRAELAKGEYLKLDYWNESAVTNKDGSVTWVEEIRINDPRIDFFAGLSKEELATIRYGVISKWSFGCFSVAGYDPKTRTIKFHLKEKLKTWMSWIPENHVNEGLARAIVRFENVRSGLSEPGTWFYDLPKKKLYYRPLKGEKISEFKPYAPTSGLVNLVRFSGDVAKGDFVHDINFKNIAFAGTRTDGERLSNGFVQQYHLQAARTSGGAVYGEGVHRVSFDSCQFRDTENYGLWFGRGCVSNKVLNSIFTNLGAGGIWLGDNKAGQMWFTNDKAPRLLDPHQNRIPLMAIEVRYMDNPATAFNVIDNCDISVCGRVNPEGCGIVMTHVSDSSVTHCDIHDLYYTGVSVGWTWGFWGSVAQRNTIAFNRIWDLGKGAMSDMGGVYTLGASFGTCISNNVIHTVKSFSYGGWGIYNDEGSEGIVWENNLVYDTTSSSYHLHYGRENILRNNILAYSDNNQITMTCVVAQRLATFEHNIVYGSGKTEKAIFRPPSVYYDTTYADIAWNSNIVWSASGRVNTSHAPYKPIMVGMDRRTEISPPQPLRYANISGFFCDPCFVNPAKRDFRLKPGSPAIQYGFKPWDFSLSGRKVAGKR